MYLIVVTQFEESLEKFNRQELLDLRRMTGYWVALSGDGIIGVYKLEMDLCEEKATIVDKFPIGRREMSFAAALMDYTLEYYKQII